MGIFAFVIARGASIDLGDAIYVTPNATGLGLLVSIPMILLLFAIVYGPGAYLQKFRVKQIEYFDKEFPKLTIPVILLLSFGAGIGEELLFRGAIQGIATIFLPITFAVMIQALIFGLAHAVNFLYVVVTALIGLWLGVVYAWTDNLYVVMVAHVFYDIIAFVLTARLIEQWNANEKILDVTPKG